MMPMKTFEKNAIQTLEPYNVAPRDDNPIAIYLDANENPYPRDFTLSATAFNRYPEPQSQQLLQLYADFLGIQPDNILITLGGDEAIKLIIEAFCNDEDAILFSPPTFGMYAISAQTVGVRSLAIPLTDQFEVDLPKVLDAAQNAKVIFLCSPNNPTGNSIKITDIEAILKATDNQSIVVLDEAYIEFSEQKSFAQRVSEFPNLAIIRTLSKAFGVAGIRCGFCVANSHIIHTLRKVIAPYPIPTPVIEIAKDTLSESGIAYMKTIVKKIQHSKNTLISALEKLPCVQQIFKSDANFLLVEFKCADSVNQHLKRHHIYVKKQSGVLNNMLRISIGTDNEMTRLIQVLTNFS